MAILGLGALSTKVGRLHKTASNRLNLDCRLVILYFFSVKFLKLNMFTVAVWSLTVG